jgi:hypothetical protein
MHYSVIVIGEDVEGRLAPFQESDYSPIGKWDWYKIGGRWDGALELKDGTKVNSALKKDLKCAPKDPYALLIDSIWVNEVTNWIEIFNQLDDETLITLVDCHC